jgi:hypothetical protein
MMVGFKARLRLPWTSALGEEPNPDDFKWELYNISNDFSESKNLADTRILRS